jgi:hypothetical protein
MTEKNEIKNIPSNIEIIGDQIIKEINTVMKYYLESKLNSFDYTLVNNYDNEFIKKNSDLISSTIDETLFVITRFLSLKQNQKIIIQLNIRREKKNILR